MLILIDQWSTKLVSTISVAFQSLSQSLPSACHRRDSFHIVSLFLLPDSACQFSKAIWQVDLTIWTFPDLFPTTEPRKKTSFFSNRFESANYTLVITMPVLALCQYVLVYFPTITFWTINGESVDNLNVIQTKLTISNRLQTLREYRMKLSSFTSCIISFNVVRIWSRGRLLFEEPLYMGKSLLLLLLPPRPPPPTLSPASRAKPQPWCQRCRFRLSAAKHEKSGTSYRTFV